MTPYITNATSITADSRQVVPGALFLAYPGESVDGRSYIADAIAKGASTILWESEGFDWHADWQAENTPIANLKQQAGVIADAFYASPSSQLWVVGVTGTNGKTSVTQWLGQCFNYLKQKTAVIGTLGNGLLGQLTSTENTTPDALVLQKLLADYVKDDVGTVAMEVSSHGLEQGRVNGVQFDVAVLTNLSRDHLDYHGSYDNYADAKKRLFTVDGLKHAVLNSDDAFGMAVGDALRDSAVGVLTYGIDSGDVRASNIRFKNEGVQFLVTTPNSQAEVSVELIGRFNIYNVLAVLSTLIISNVALADAVEAVAKIVPLSGRMEKFGGGHLPLVIVDYAHTPDSLRNVLLALKDNAAQKVVCVFGCGGNRDQGKRALMGQVVSELADEVVITTDNPRNENPEAIIESIVAGVDGSYLVEVNRAKAIANTVKQASAGDVVLIAGKGHEAYQDIAGVKHYFSDAEQVQQALKLYKVANA